MAKREIKVGSVDQTIDVFVLNSSSTTGAGLTGLAYNTASLTCYYRKGATGSSTALTLATQTVGGAHSDGGFVEVDATNMPGVYRLDLSDTIVAATGAVTMYLRGATNMAPVVLELEIVDNIASDVYARIGAPAGASVSADIAAVKVDTAAVKVKTDFLPSATAGAAGGLFIAGSNAATSITTALTANIVGDVTGNLSGSVGSVTGAVGSVTGAVGSVTGAVGSVTGLTNTTIADQVWDEILSGHAGVGSTGAALSAAGGSGDPWSTALPGAYGAGTAGNIVGTYIDAAITSRMASYTQPTGFLAATFPGTVASTTNITAGTISTVTTLTNLPSIPANWLTAAGIAAGALDGKGNWNIGKTGYSLTTAPLDAAGVRGAVGLAAADLDTQLAALPTAAEVRAEMDSNSTKLASIETRGDNVVCRGTVSATSPTTTSFTASAMSPSGAAADQFKGRIIVFDKATTTAALRGQATDITANTSASLPVFTFTALTTAPVSGDSFSIV